MVLHWIHSITCCSNKQHDIDISSSDRNKTSVFSVSHRQQSVNNDDPKDWNSPPAGSCLKPSEVLETEKTSVTSRGVISNHQSLKAPHTNIQQLTEQHEQQVAGREDDDAGVKQHDWSYRYNKESSGVSEITFCASSR